MNDLAERAARKAGEVLLSYWRNLPPGSVSEKARNDFVSRADRESEVVIRDVILGESAGDAFLGEEGGASAGTTGRGWIVDPLDGTSNFIAGFPFWSISIARRDETGLESGVIFDPLRDEMYSARRGSGAYRNGERIRCSSQASLDGSFLATGFPFRNRERIDDYLAIFRALFLRARAIRRAGSAALDLACVASGVFDGFFEFALSPWDIAAGAVLIREAGGFVADFSGGEEYLKSGNVIAGGRAVAAEIVEVVRRIGAGQPEIT